VRRNMETITKARVPLATSRYWVSMKRFKGRLERVYCPNISQRVRWFIPGPRSSDRQRMLPEVGYCRVDVELQNAAFFSTPQWTRGDRDLISMMAQSGKGAKYCELCLSVSL